MEQSIRPGGDAAEPLSGRAQHLLKTLIERYVREGQPVGSRTLARESGLDLSPATVRNVMVDLEELGLVRSPHTSAGRVPTARGYRLFVDTLLTVEPLAQAQIDEVRSQLESAPSREQLMTAASSLLSDLTHLAGLVTVHRPDRAVLRHVEFLPLSDNQVLVILVVNEREVHNQIIRTRRTYARSELEQASNYLNTEFAGRDLEQIRSGILGELRDASESMSRMMLAIVEMADKGLVAEPGEETLVLAGQTNLMEYGELSDVEKLRHLFEAFQRKRDILHLLDQSLRAKGVRIFIGEESGYDVLGECSVVTASYSADDDVVGVIGVIGPTRMAYDRVIPVVDLTARLLGAALNHNP